MDQLRWPGGLSKHLLSSTSPVGTGVCKRAPSPCSSILTKWALNRSVGKYLGVDRQQRGWPGPVLTQKKSKPSCDTRRSL